MVSFDWRTKIQTEINLASRKLSERLIAIENESQAILDEDGFATCRVCEKLRRHLADLVGIAGYTTLLQRALTLAKRETPALVGVEVRADGSMVGLEGAAAAASPFLVTHLVQLLMTFIGESLTTALLQDIWLGKDKEELFGGNGYEQQGPN